jgi:hypothetical protein
MAELRIAYWMDHQSGFIAANPLNKKRTTHHASKIFPQKRAQAELRLRSGSLLLWLNLAVS